MVVSAVFLILSAVVLANHSRFGNLIILQNLAHDVALSIREAQVYGIAVRRCDPGSITANCTTGNQFSIGYGMHFAVNGNYVLFADTNTNGKFDTGETVKVTTVAGGYSVTQLCAPSPTTCGLLTLDVFFRRPEPDACINGTGGDTIGSELECTSSIQRATITLRSPRGDQAVVVVEKSGQISVQ